MNSPQQEQKPRFFNCHAHCFTMDHVPDFFFSRLVPVGKVLRKRWVKNLVEKGPVTGRLPFLIRLVVYVLSVINLLDQKKLRRLLTMVRFGSTDDQQKVVEAIRQYYPQDTGFIMLTMDMEYMGAGKPKKKFRQQLDEVAGLRQQSDGGRFEYKDLIYPFIFIDPRRLQAGSEEEARIEKDFQGDAFFSYAENQLRSGNFQGLKIYPALGYYPFDHRMKRAYDLAIELNLPIMTHCAIGPVHHKNRVEEQLRVHPVTGQSLPNLKPAEYQQFFSHPLNYECLLNLQHLRKVWGDAAPDYRNLKICLGHWGGGEDWMRYLENDWADVYDKTKGEKCPALNLDNWHTDPDKSHNNFTWFTVIHEMIKSGEYPNLYTDISYTLNNPQLLPMLRMLLESNRQIREHVLFGTDFYMVSKAVSERAYSINVRAYLGETLFNQIAITNARTFLNSKVQQYL